MKYAVKLHDYNYKNAIVDFQEEINIERLKTMYNDDLSDIRAELILTDPRRFTPQQRRLYFALLGDVYKWSGQGVSELHEIFESEYTVKHYSLISLKDESESTVSDVNKLIEIVIEFIFEWNVPVAKSYQLLPRDESYYLYQCCKHRKCALCGKHADIHHALNLVGIGNNRSSVNHLRSYFIALCREHHNEVHSLGLTEFTNKYHVKPIKLDGSTLVRLGLMSKKNLDKYEEEIR